jgi:hypothetical protein
LGWGTFFMVILTAGFWLLTIPFYPKRCTTCGCTEGGAARASLALAAGPPSRERQLLTAYGIIGAFVLVVLLIWLANLGSPDKPASTPATQTAIETVSSPVVITNDNAPESATDAPTSDGRTYSVALVAKATEFSKLFVQGRIVRFGYAGMSSRPFAVLEDEHQPDKLLLCAMMADEGAEAVSLYRVGEVVQAFGEYMGALSIPDSPGTPVLSDCKIASPTDNVVRPTKPRPTPLIQAQAPPYIPPVQYAPPADPSSTISSKATPEPLTVETQSAAHPSQLQFESGVRLLIRLNSITRQPDGSFAFRGTLLLPVTLTGALSLDQSTKLVGSGAANGRTALVTGLTVSGENYALQAANGSNKGPGAGPAVELDPGKVLEMWFASASVYEKTTGAGSQP